MGAPPISACTTHLNDWPGVRNFVESLLPQLGPDDEIVVVDAGSEGPSRAFLEDVARRDERVKVVVDPGCLRGAGRDRAWRLAKNQIVLHCDADRTWRPDGWARLRGLASRLRAGPVKLVSPLTEHQGCGGWLLRRDQLERVDGYDTTLQYFEDVDLDKRLRGHGPVPDADFDAYSFDDKSKMRRISVNVRYYREMFRDGARMRIDRDYLARPSRGHLRRTLLVWFVGRPAYRRGRRLPPARSVAQSGPGPT
ncbi:MAG: glycosyltransferase [Euryarchaeota archaeon]|nr:glycosyltransferase [Euryarchaeota archaeon]